jgi:abortive infection bacteriophage resistance protein
MPDNGPQRLPFNKPALSVEEQAEKIISRGLVAARHDLEIILNRMSYYRFTGYLWWFYDPDADPHTVFRGTTLEDVLRLYQFDARLRSFIMRLAHTIEIWLRAELSNSLADRYGPMGYLDPNIYKNTDAYGKDLKKLDEILGRKSPEPFIQSFYEKYSDDRPPVWMSTELMTLGLLSKWYDNLKQDSIRKQISRKVDLHPSVLSSFLRGLTVYRNAAAHHSRVWNRQTSLTLSEVRRPPALLRYPMEESDRSSLYYLLILAAFIVRQIDSANSVVVELRDHLLTAEEEWLIEMGFPQEFECDDLWNPATSQS